MVVDGTWNAATGTLSGEMQCITQLMGGDQTAKDIIHTKCKALSSTEGWTARDMIR